MAWLYVVLASLIDVGWATLIKRFGFSSPWMIALIIGLVLIPPFLLSLAMKTLPMGTAYAVFVGLAACGIVLVGIVAFGESTSLLRLFFLSLIVVGIIGLRLLENPVVTR